MRFGRRRACSLNPENVENRELPAAIRAQFLSLQQVMTNPPNPIRPEKMAFRNAFAVPAAVVGIFLF
jgi:hypothetical protein